VATTSLEHLLRDTDYRTSVELDVSGLVCPQPTAVVRRCLAELETGEELVVTGDYPPAERSIRRSCYKHGFAVSEGPPADEGEFSVRIVVTESASLETTVPAESADTDGE
jgi:tRNA 2-thiouridine synthesizing protein A